MRNTILLSIGFFFFLLQAMVHSAAHSADVVLEEANGYSWKRGNTHTHSLWSDGDDYLEMIAMWYREKGYDFLCFSDHNVLANKERWIDVKKSKGGMAAYKRLKEKFHCEWVEERTKDGKLEVRLKTYTEVSEKIAIPGKYLLVQSEEISDRYKKYPIHMNVANVDKVFPPAGGDSVREVMQNNVDAVAQERKRSGKPTLIHLNHPNFHYAVTAEDLMKVDGENFFEVYNGHPGVNDSGDHDHASTEKIWDIILAMRISKIGLPLMYGVGTDDGHSYLKIGTEGKIPNRRSEPGRGWVVVLTKELTPTAIIHAMEAGRFYSSSGVKVKRIASNSKEINLALTPKKGDTYTIEFIGTKKGFDSTSKPVLDKQGKAIRTTRIYSDEVGQVLKTVQGNQATYTFQGDELYVRARITSSRKHPNPSEANELERAWIQPVRGPAAPEVVPQVKPLKKMHKHTHTHTHKHKD